MGELGARLCRAALLLSTKGGWDVKKRAQRAQLYHLSLFVLANHVPWLFQTAVKEGEGRE